MSRRLVVTADDFGLTPAVNRGIEFAHRHGIVTSASLMVRRAHAEDAVCRSRRLSGLTLGLHVELVSYEVHDGEWVAVDQVVDPLDVDAVRREVTEQVRRFVALVGRSPTHLDSHHHLHREAPVGPVVDEVARSLGVAVRGVGDWTYRGDFYGQYGCARPWPDGITAAALVAVLESLQPGTTELACHPATAPDPRHGAYDAERVAELVTLCDPAVRSEVARCGVELVGSDAVVQPNRPET